jgi:hypothetical protein
MFSIVKSKYIQLLKYATLDRHYGTFLVTQHASKPAEYKHVGQDDDINTNRLGQLRRISPSLQHYV